MTDRENKCIRAGRLFAIPVVALALAACQTQGPTLGTASSDSGRVTSPSVYSTSAYGRVTAIRTVQADAQASGAGALLGAVIGGVLGNQVGGGTGRTAATVAGAVGGAVAGHSIEKNRSSGSAAYEVTVRLDNGESRQITVADTGGLAIGERVRVEGTNIVRL